MTPHARLLLASTVIAIALTQSACFRGGTSDDSPIHLNRNMDTQEKHKSQRESRFFVDGKGLFYLHVDDKVYAVLCDKGDLISVPANTPHWFDMGENPCFKCIRLFTTAEGWVASFTGSDIAKSFPTFDEYIAGLS